MTRPIPVSRTATMTTVISFRCRKRLSGSAMAASAAMFRPAGLASLRLGCSMMISYGCTAGSDRDQAEDVLRVRRRAVSLPGGGNFQADGPWRPDAGPLEDAEPAH